MTDAPAISLSTVVVGARDQVSAQVEGEAVILNFADGVYYGLDGVGAFVWELLREPRSVADLRDAVTTEYDVDGDTAAADLLELLADLASRRLVDVVSPPAA